MTVGNSAKVSGVGGGTVGLILGTAGKGIVWLFGSAAENAPRLGSVVSVKLGIDKSGNSVVISVCNTPKCWRLGAVGNVVIGHGGNTALISSSFGVTVGAFGADRIVVGGSAKDNAFASVAMALCTNASEELARLLACCVALVNSVSISVSALMIDQASSVSCCTPMAFNPLNAAAAIWPMVVAPLLMTVLCAVACASCTAYSCKVLSSVNCSTRRSFAA